MSFLTDEVLPLGQNFVGKNSLRVAEGVFVSSALIGSINGREVYARFRITDSDIAGHGLSTHANFEKVYKVTGSTGRSSYKTLPGTETTHVYFTDLP